MKLKKHHGVFLSLILAISTFAGAAIFYSVKEEVYTPTFATYTNGDAATYYNSLDTTKTGNDFLKDLRTLNLTKRQSTVGYDSMGTTPSGQFKYTDYDPNYVQYDSNGQPYGTRISSFYTYTSAASWNREHVWPNSHGGGSKGDTGSPYPDADIHMPRPTISSENSSRGNSFFVEGMNHSSNGWDPYTAGYSAESRGEAVRITFYCTLVNSKLILAPNDTSPSGTDPVTGQSYGSGHTMGNLETLIKWNINYAVTQREKNRNEGAEYLQGNRNPFVDHPEYACRIWGNVNSNIKSMCDAASWEVGDSVSISHTNKTVTVDEEFNLSAYVSSGSCQISWTTSDSAVVEVDTATTNSGANAKFTAVGPGTATITASATINSNPYTATCVVTVNTSGGGGGGQEDGDYTLITNNSFLSNGDQVVITTLQSSSPIKGVSGQSNKDATVSETESQWLKYTVSSANSNGFKLYDSSAEQYIASPTGNEFKYSSSGGTCSADSTGKLVCNNRYLCVNGTNYRFYTSVGSYIPFYIYKVNAGSSSTKTLESISISTPKTDYTVGDTFVKPTVTAHFDGGDDEVVTSSASFSGCDLNTAGNYTVTVSYTYGGNTEYESYQITVAAPAHDLSSISLNTTNVKTKFMIGDTFTYEGLVVTANYTDSTQSVVTPTSVSSPDMSVSDVKIIIVTYSENNIEKSNTYTITICNRGIELSTITTVYWSVGQTITKSDIGIAYLTGEEITDFVFPDYQFKYSDAPGGGESQVKQFTITYDDLECEFGVMVSRDEYTDSTLENKTITYSDLPTSYQTGNNERTSADGISFIAYNCAHYSNSKKMQFRANNGYLITTQSLELNSLTIESPEGTLSVFAGTTSNSVTTKITGSNNVYDLRGYHFFKVIKDSSNVGYCKSLIVSVGAVETVTNVSNYIMFNDTNNQCVTKLDIAIEKLNTLSNSDRDSFWNSDDYVIKSARERLLAWAKNQGRVLSYSNNTFSAMSDGLINDSIFSYSSLIIIVAITSISLLSLATLLVNKKRRHTLN